MIGQRIPLAGKRPLVKEWPTLPPDSPQWKAAERGHPGCNWGLRLDGLTVIDCDTPEAVAWWVANAPPTSYQSTARDIFERRSFWYRGEYVSPGPFSLPGSTAHAGEIKSGSGHQVVIPPSVHPDTRKTYRWVSRELFDETDLPPVPTGVVDELREIVVSWGEGSEGWDFIPEGNRDNALTAVAGLLRRHGASEAALERALYLLNSAMCRPPLAKTSVGRIARSVARYEVDANGRGAGGGDIELIVDD